MPRLTPCPSCHAHVLVDDRECPHCGAALRTATAPLAAAVVASLMLGGCPAGDDVGEPEYGVPLTESTSAGTGTTGGEATGTDSGGATAGAESSTGGGTASTGDTDPSAGEADYGVAETTSGTTSIGEPEYGVPETSSSSGSSG